MSEENEQTEEEQVEEQTEEVQADTEAEEAPAEETPPAEEEEEEPAPAEEEEEEEEPAHELSRPPVVDLKALLQPISDDAPSGEYMRYSGVYDEIGEARRADEVLGTEGLGMDLKVAEFPKVIELAVPVLEKESKDLQISAWLAEALVNVHGFEGLRDSLKLLSRLQDKFWETLYPEIDEGDMEGRANAIAWMEKETAFAIQKATITGGEGYSYFDYLDSKKYDIPDDMSMLELEEQKRLKALEAEADKENKVTAEKWKKEIENTRRASCEEISVAVEECVEALKKLNLSIEEKFDVNQSPSLRNLQKILEDIKLRTDKLLKQKREEEPDETDDEATEGEGGEGEGKGSGDGKGSISSTKSAIQNRKEALRQLTKLAEFFRKTEPHSPVSYLVTRAVKWGNMPLETWLQDVIKDETILFQLRQTLGFNTNTGNEEETDAQNQ